MEVTDITKGVVTVENPTGFYRVVYYTKDLNAKTDGNRAYQYDEFLSAEDAIMKAEIFNTSQLHCNDRDFGAIEEWAEVVSYRETERRWAFAEKQTETDELVNQAVSEHRAELCKEIDKLEKRNRKLVRKLRKTKAKRQRAK